MRRVALLCLLLAACSDFQPGHGPFYVIIDTYTRDTVCGGPDACALLAENTAIVAEYDDTPAWRGHIRVPEDFEWPPFLDDRMDAKRFQWVEAQNRRCGRELAVANGFQADWNGAINLCHEVMHLAGWTH